jgi:nicotinic acetylcholine receptor, invertebrate
MKINIQKNMIIIIHEQEDADWGFVALVLDRLFLWLFTMASLFGTFSILCEAPAL